MRSGLERHAIWRLVRICVAFLAGTLAAVVLIAIIGFLAFLVPALPHIAAPLSLTEVAFLVAVACGSTVALYVLRSGRNQPQDC